MSADTDPGERDIEHKRDESIHRATHLIGDGPFLREPRDIDDLDVSKSGMSKILGELSRLPGFEPPTSQTTED